MNQITIKPILQFLPIRRPNTKRIMNRIMPSSGKPTTKSILIIPKIVSASWPGKKLVKNGITTAIPPINPNQPIVNVPMKNMAAAMSKNRTTLPICGSALRAPSQPVRKLSFTAANRCVKPEFGPSPWFGLFFYRTIHRPVHSIVPKYAQTLRLSPY